MPAVVGRDAELGALRDFVSSISDGASTVVLEGEAGMGKTTLWRAGVDTAGAEGLCVLQAQPAESETALSFSGLGDLLDPFLDDALATLPSAQRAALARALVLEEAEGPAPDAHAAGVALLNVVRGLSSLRPVVVAVDDVQWLDAASSGALAYAARRLRAEEVGLLLARRSGLESALLDELRRSSRQDRYIELEVGPLAATAFHQIVHAHLGISLPRPLLAEVHHASGGNPFYGLEIVRTLARSGVSVEAGKPLPVPDSLHDLVHGRLLALPSESRDFLTAAAAHAHPTISITELASGVGRDVGLAPACEARIVETDGERIRFTHPLLAAGALEAADPQRRAEIHARLAEVLDDPEARAWQLAASVEEPDEEVATVLEQAADHARARGAPRPAALLLDCARELTPADEPDRAIRRAVDAAYLHYEAGDSRRAEAQLTELVEQLGPGPCRARALVRLARVRSYEAQAEAANVFEQAVLEAGGDPEVLAVAHEGVATCLYRLCQRLDDAIGHAEISAELARGLGDDALAAEALGTRWVAELLLGLEEATTTGRKALALQPASEGRRVLAQPRFAAAATHLFWTGALEQAAAELADMLRCARELGDESSPPTILATLAQVTCEVGELDRARALALEGQEAAEQSGQRTLFAHNLAAESLADAQLGRFESARDAALRALALVPATGGRHAEFIARRALGQMGLASDAPESTVEALDAMVTFVRREGVREPGLMPFVVDLVQALVELGRGDEAEEVLDWYEGNARQLKRITALANCARCRGLLAAQRGDLDDAFAAYGEALAGHTQITVPLDHGRTLLALGAALRRAKHRREARKTLDEAVAVFEAIGATAWAERAQAELRRISGRAASPGALTPAEERVALLVADGKTNKEVAAALFLSDRTVEGHLAHIFGKLGIRHRGELAGALQTHGIDPSNTGDTPVSASPSSP